MKKYKILIDEKFYQNTKLQVDYLMKFLKMVSDYFDAKIITFEPFTRPIKSFNKSSNYNKINKAILLTHKIEKRDLDLVIHTNSDLTLKNMGFTDEFIDKIFYILNSDTDNVVIIPLIYSKNHRELQSKHINDKIFFIGNFDEEVNSNISMWIENNEVINLNQPSIDNKFPAASICNGFDVWRSEILSGILSNEDDKISSFGKIGLEVAKRNNYVYDEKLTYINKKLAKKDKNGNSPKRQIFTSKNRNVYLSTDFLHGGFEVYNNKPDHQGQYKFNGVFEKEPDDKSHPLYLK